VVVLVAVLASGGHSHRSASHGAVAGAGPAGATAGRTDTGAAVAQLRVNVAHVGTLPSALQDAAVAPSGAGALMLGGLDQGEGSLPDAVSLSAPGNGARTVLATRIGALPGPLHDAAAATVAGRTYLFGGGVSSSFASIEQVSAAGVATPAGSLPKPASDLAAAVIGETVYLVGGYTGAVPLRTILAWRPGSAARTAALLPKPLRYAAVSAVDGRLLIAGGTSGENASSSVYSFEPASGEVRQIATLPHPLTHASAAALRGAMLVFGGREAAPDSQSAQILAISTQGAVHAAGALPRALSDVAAVTVGDHVLLAGGRDGAGRVRDDVLSVSAR
jgi:hypothetical protein